MLDTLHLMIDDFEVMPNHNLEVTASLTGNNYRLFGDVSGIKAYLNLNYLNLDIKNLNGKPFCFVHFSLPKLAGKTHNTYGINKNEAVKAFDYLCDVLADNGILVNLDTAKVTRLDVALNIEADYQLEAYTPLFGMMQDTRLIKNQSGNTTLWRNKTQEYCIYDKRQELADNGLMPESFADVADNTIRFETRQKKHKQVVKSLDVASLDDVLVQYDDLDAQASKNWQERLFYIDAQGDTKSELLIMLALIEACKSKNNREWASQSINVLGLYLIASCNDAERKVLLNCYDKRISQDFARRIRQVNADTISVKLADLYAELQAKIKAYDTE